MASPSASSCASSYDNPEQDDGNRSNRTQDSEEERRKLSAEMHRA